MAIPNTTAAPNDTRLAAPAPVANNNGMTPRYKGERSHQDRTQADVSGFEGRFAYRITGGTVVAGKFDNQDTVLCGEGYQQDTPGFAYRRRTGTPR